MHTHRIQLVAIAVLTLCASTIGGLRWSDAETASRQVTLAATGDVLLHGAVVRSARAFAGEGGWNRSFEGLAKVFSDDEIGIVNLETPLSESVVTPRKGDHPVLGAPPEVAKALADAGVHVASVANNHAFDQDSAGLSQTIDALRAANVSPVGAGASPEEAVRPQLLTRNGLKVAFLAAAGPMNDRHKGRGPGNEKLFVARLSSEDVLLDAVTTARSDGADLVVVLLHWMWDYREGPRRYEKGLAARLVERGADVLLGAGPHLLHTVDRLPSPRGDAIVAWSLGNFISGMGMRWRPGYRAPADMHPVSVHPGTRDAVVLHLDVQVSTNGRVSIGEVSASPLWTINNWVQHLRDRSLRHDIRVITMGEAPEAVRDVRIPAIKTALGSAVTLR